MIACVGGDLFGEATAQNFELAGRDAIRRANLYAALSTTRVGTQKSFVTREEFEAAWSRL